MDDKKATGEEIAQFAAEFVALLIKWENQAKQRKSDS